MALTNCHWHKAMDNNDLEFYVDNFTVPNPVLLNIIFASERGQNLLIDLM